MSPPQGEQLPKMGDAFQPEMKGFRDQGQPSGNPVFKYFQVGLSVGERTTYVGT